MISFLFSLSEFVSWGVALEFIDHCVDDDEDYFFNGGPQDSFVCDLRHAYITHRSVVAVLCSVLQCICAIC